MSASKAKRKNLERLLCIKTRSELYKSDYCAHCDMLDIYVTKSFYRVTHLDVWLYRKTLLGMWMQFLVVHSWTMDFQYDEPTHHLVFRLKYFSWLGFFFAASKWYLMINLLFLQNKSMVVWENVANSAYTFVTHSS